MLTMLDFMFGEGSKWVTYRHQENFYCHKEESEKLTEVSYFYRLSQNKHQLCKQNLSDVL
jgi:hypothetical protein